MFWYIANSLPIHQGHVEQPPLMFLHLLVLYYMLPTVAAVHLDLHITVKGSFHGERHLKFFRFQRTLTDSALAIAALDVLE